MAKSETNEKESTLTGERVAARAKPSLLLGNPAIAPVVTIDHALMHVYFQGFYIPSCTTQIVNLDEYAGFQTVINNVIPSIVMI